MDNTHSELTYPDFWSWYKGLGSTFTAIQSSSTLLQLYLAFAWPHLEYAAMVWGPPTRPLGKSKGIHTQNVYEGLSMLHYWNFVICLL